MTSDPTASGLVLKATHPGISVEQVRQPPMAVRQRQNRYSDEPNSSDRFEEKDFLCGI
jgi:hypothetical protein